MKNKVSNYIVVKDELSNMFYIGQIRLDPDGIIEPCSKVSVLYETFREAEQELKNLNGEQ